MRCTGSMDRLFSDRQSGFSPALKTVASTPVDRERRPFQLLQAAAPWCEVVWMDHSPGGHRPFKMQQSSSGQFPFTGLECDFFQLGGFQVQMTADHAAKSQRQRRGRGIDEADCSSLRHHSPNDRRKGWMRNSGVRRSAFGVRRSAFGGSSLALDPSWFQTKSGGRAFPSTQTIAPRWTKQSGLQRCVRSNRGFLRHPK